MFSFLKTKKNNGINAASDSTLKNTSDIPYSTNPSLNKTKSTESTKDTWVFIWNMTADKVGHAAVQIGGSKPKMQEEDPGEYASIHPNDIPSAGLTSVLPLPAHIATNLSQDMETLGASEHAVAITDMDGPIKVKPDKEAKPLPPDHIYHFKALNTSAMSDHLKESHKKVTTGEMGYQLFPNVNLVGFFKDSSAFISQDPIDIEMHRRISEKQTDNSKVHNCTSLVSEVLNKGGLPIKHSKIKPWVITPNGLSEELSSKAHKF
ncbi:hypothetical protein DGG96_14680 [Legionella qingyii]|uniref:Uncharacterized protein n=1 Tax=Legionella qingyii TaxID=2184757 RepID=A0A317U0X5_9GAMM|nr:hypothetical protein [Legionella qingyii]PWY54865.1 hypothetical protein DGG96_14680 [Legionella qingyii]RUR20934.1 hypothetical protein ELY20_14110 [Legionella qingyii]RUR23216.1 hypothetical protein ELY16_13555 [Legionella qingyii]